MCGRFGLTRPERLDLQRFGVAHFPPLTPRFNIPPSAQVLTVRTVDGVRRADFVEWGLLPSWTKDPAGGMRLSNARSETAYEKPAFRNAIKSRRCLILADVFYEWQLVPGQTHKQPHAIRIADAEPFALGGIWEHWFPPAGGGEGVESCAILTTAANSHMLRIHDRMPVIVPTDKYNAWLDPRTPMPAVQDLMHPIPSEMLASWPISLRINNPKADDERVLEPVER